MWLIVLNSNLGVLWCEGKSREKENERIWAGKIYIITCFGMGLPFDALLSGAPYLKVSWKKDFKRARLPAIIERGRGQCKKGRKEGGQGDYRTRV